MVPSHSTVPRVHKLVLCCMQRYPHFKQRKLLDKSYYQFLRYHIIKFVPFFIFMAIQSLLLGKPWEIFSNIHHSVCYKELRTDETSKRQWQGKRGFPLFRALS